VIDVRTTAKLATRRFRRGAFTRPVVAQQPYAPAPLSATPPLPTPPLPTLPTLTDWIRSAPGGLLDMGTTTVKPPGQTW